MDSSPYRIGFDVGGTKIECAVLTPEGEICFRERQDTPQDDYLGMFVVLGQLFEAARREISVDAYTVGVGFPGALHPDTNRVMNANTTVLIDKPFAVDLAMRFACNVVFANDANCFAWSEAVDGAAAGANAVFGVILGTGVGGGLVLNQTVIEGPNRIAGEWGHNRQPRRNRPLDGRACYCGLIDCQERYLSASGLVETYLKQGGSEPISTHEIWDRSEAGDAIAHAAITTYKTDLAEALAGVINLVDPDVIVLGGGMSNPPGLYEGLSELTAQFTFHATSTVQSLKTKIVQAKWGDSSGVRGAAWLPKSRETD